MKKLNLLLLLVILFTTTYAQKSNVQNAEKALRKEKLSDAVKFIEEAYQNSSTSNDVKMHNYRGDIYFEIHSNENYNNLYDSLFNSGIIASLECAKSWESLAKHPKSKKWFEKEEINDKITKAGVALFNTGVSLYSSGKYNEALSLYNKIFDLIPFDNKGDLARSNVTKESIWFNAFFVADAINNNNLAKDYLTKLMDVGYQDPKIYSLMADLYQKEDNMNESLRYIKLGREMFEFNVDLIISELNYYLSQSDFTKAEELLNLAISEDPNNHMLFFALGSSYDNLNEFDKAVKAYEEAIEIKSDFFDALYNLGVMFYNKGGDMIKEANNMKDWKKADALTKKAEDTMMKALPHIESCYDIDGNDKNVLLILKELYYRNGNTNKYKEVTDKLK